MLATPGVAPAWWDQDQWATRLGYAARPVGESAALFRALRTANLRLLAGVPRRWWDACAGVHEVRGRQTVAEFVALGRRTTWLIYGRPTASSRKGVGAERPRAEAPSNHALGCRAGWPPAHSLTPIGWADDIEHAQ
jgi:hypothetical protein